VTDLLEHWFSYAADIFDYALGVETVVMMGGIMYGEPADEREAQEHCCQLLSRFSTIVPVIVFPGSESVLETRIRIQEQ
jgi:hypothetical protein